MFKKDKQYYKFSLYGFLKNLRFFEPFFILFLRDKGLSFTEIGVLYATREILINIFEIPTGILSDVLGRRRTMVWSFSAYIISFIIFYFTSSFAVFFVAILFFSFGETFRTGTHKAMIFHYLELNNWKKYKVKYYGNTRSWSQVGSAISSIIAAFLVVYTGDYSIIFIASTIPYLLDLINLATYPKILDGNLQKFSFSELKNSFSKVIKDVLKSFKNKIFLKTIISSAIYAAYYKALKDFLQPIIKTFAVTLPILMGLETQQKTSIIVGGIYSVLFLLTAISSRKAEKVSKKFKSLEAAMNFTLIIGLAVGLFSGVFYNFEMYILAIILFILIYVIENIRKPITTTKVSETIKQESMATGLSTESQFETLFTALFALLMGIFADKFNVGIAVIIVTLIILGITPFIIVKNQDS